MGIYAVAPTNIALIKYWGKRNQPLHLPMNSSLSITLDRFYTETKVTLLQEGEEDVLWLNGALASEGDQIKNRQFMDHIRNIAGRREGVRVESMNHVPTGAGLASSASAYCALALAGSEAYGLGLDRPALSRLARLGSGSASRSIYGGYVLWEKGLRENGEDSCAHQVLEARKWPISIISVMVTKGPKELSSREGMQRTVRTSPFYSGWLTQVEQDLETALDAIKTRDLEKLGTVAEANALAMHGTMMGARPPIVYWRHETMEVLEAIWTLRKKGLHAYATIDAGPNVKVLTSIENEGKLLAHLKGMACVQEVIACRPGTGAYLK